MNRRNFLQHSALGFAALSLSQQKLLNAFFQPSWKITMLTDTVGVFTERGGTIAFLLQKNGIVVVDSEFPDQSKHLIDELKNRSEQTCKLLINTHHHADHTGGNISFKGIVDHVLAHENSLKNQKNVTARNPDSQLYPDQTYKDSWCQDFDKEKICLNYYGPAHTDGDSFIHFQHANIVHTGDLVNNRRHPYVDRTAGASMKNWMTVLENGMKKYDNKTVYVFGHAADGHEVYGKKADVELFRDYLGNVLKFTESQIKAGKSKEEILKSTEIPGSPQWKGDGIQRPLAAAFDELMA